jgi:hypothetical protein
MAYYFNHPDLTLPDDESVIWRYMDFPKLQSTLQRGSFFFSRADRQTDQLEGEYPAGMLAELEHLWGVVVSDDGNSYTFSQWHTKKEIPSRLLSCWSVRSTESRKMWSSYTTTKDSVAIHSTIQRLKLCFETARDEGPVVWIGRVRYGEKESRLPGSIHKWNVNYFLYPFFAKREVFRWENEIRATINLSRKKQLSLDHNDNGCFIVVDLHTLIESIWLHPLATKNFQNKVVSTLPDLGFTEIPVFQSDWEALAE